MNVKTISDYPLAIGEILRREARRSGERTRLACFFRRPRRMIVSRENVARISPNETVFSNLPLR